MRQNQLHARDVCGMSEVVRKVAALDTVAEALVYIPAVQVEDLEHSSDLEDNLEQERLLATEDPGEGLLNGSGAEEHQDCSTAAADTDMKAVAQRREAEADSSEQLELVVLIGEKRCAG